MLPLISSICQASLVIIDKLILTRRRVAFHVFVPLLFLFLFLLTIIAYPFVGDISPAFFESKNLLIFILMIATALIWNYFYYHGIEMEKIQKFELILMFQPLLTIFLATIFLRGESNIHIIIAAFLASIALIFAQGQKHHFNLKDGAMVTFMAVIFMSIELILIDIVLKFMSPVALYAVRTGVVFLVFFLYYRPKTSQIAPLNYLFILINAILGATQMITKFYGFQEFGVVYTSLILILAPVLVYLGSIYFLHEKLKFRTFVSVLVILACIIYATIYGK